MDPEDLAEIREEEPEWLAAQIGLVVQQAEMDAAEALELAAAEEAELYGEEPE